jgi:murein DD-endopeptidase MepM/ murein hydrolase activator NlpD/phage tail protein X
MKKIVYLLPLLVFFLSCVDDLDRGEYNKEVKLFPSVDGDNVDTRTNYSDEKDLFVTYWKNRDKISLWSDELVDINKNELNNKEITLSVSKDSIASINELFFWKQNKKSNGVIQAVYPYNPKLTVWEDIVHNLSLPDIQYQNDYDSTTHLSELDNLFAYYSNSKISNPALVFKHIFNILDFRVLSEYKLYSIEIKTTHDDIMRRKLLEYAAANASVQLPTDDVIFNTSETFSWLNYTVKRGDSVSKIAADHSLSMDAIIASNNLSNARNLREGDIIRIPNMDGIPYTVVKGDTLKGIAEKFNVPLEAILDANDIQNDNISAGTVYFIPGAKMRAEDLRLAMGDLFVYPVHGRLTSPYGWRKDPFSGQRRYHRALDIAAPSGTAVKAAMAGKVTTVGTNEIFGNYVIITHSGGFQSMYAHLKSSSVVQGVGVKQGDIIGEVGSTGRSTGPHLHFAIYKNQRAVNPLDYLKI